jgi:hypothetical protein
MLPTPTTRANQKGKGRTGTIAEYATGERNPSGTSRRRLNPRFVSWMMGLPQDWTVVRIAPTPESAAERTAPDTKLSSSTEIGPNKSTHSGTPSSGKPQRARGRRLRKG